MKTISIFWLTFFCPIIFNFFLCCPLPYSLPSGSSARTLRRGRRPSLMGRDGRECRRISSEKHLELRRQSLKTENCVDYVEKRRIASTKCVLTENQTMRRQSSNFVFGPKMRRQSEKSQKGCLFLHIKNGQKLYSKK